MLIAIIDDDASLLRALGRLLSECGYGVLPFPSGEAFLKYAEEGKAACLLVDIGLGGISGLEMVRQLAASGFNAPVIFMSGFVDEGIERQSRALGCVAYLRKPFPPEQLLSAIRKAACLDVEKRPV